ncbi:TolC family protein [Silvibacterium dinghuense]|uniref:TolC family protein n=1 Tax=Silvibacterium dinghuense TaxID=1560006 RepID=UPI001E639590|nr:TolC family protein [Silvibacterium dinghuense]
MHAQSHGSAPLPEAPKLQLLAQSSAPQGQTAALSDSSESAAARLTLHDAEQMAIRNNPHISAKRLLALAQHQVVRENRAAELPSVAGGVTAEDANQASRISAGSLTASRLFEHAGAGASASQLITDFGRTRNLVLSSNLEEKAQDASALATTQDIVLTTDQAFYNVLEAQALLNVAQQNVKTRQTTDDQIGVMTKNKLKSTLDLSFADVNLSQAKLLLLDAQNNASATMAALDEVLGLDTATSYQLVADGGALAPPPPDADQLLKLALEQRPDLQALDLSHQAAVKFSHAQRDQLLPSISALGTAGAVPVRPGEYYNSSWWGAVGVNMNIPIFNGFLYTSQAKEASIRAEAAAEQTRALRDRVVRDVRTSWLAAQTAYQKVAVTTDLLNQANLALKLAQTRYQMGLSSIVELSQAQYQQTDAAIGNSNAQYQYRLSLATLNYEIGSI